MNILLLLDNKIKEDQLAQVKRELSAIYKKNCDIKLRFTDEWRDFSYVPKEWYDDEAEGIQKSYIASVTKEIYKRYAEDIDEVVFFIHRDHWNLTGVWGWNLSKTFNGYGIQQCRFDNKNLANTLGTIYHEQMHDHDTFIYTYTGVKIESVLRINDWDDDLVHGGKYSGTTYGWKYIRHNENQESLKLIAPYLTEALKKRRELWDTKKIGYLQEIIRLAEQVIVLQRARLAQLRGDIAIKP